MKIIRTLLCTLLSIISIAPSYGAAPPLTHQTSVSNPGGESSVANSSTSTNLSVYFDNNSAAVSHLDYTNLSYPSSSVDSGGNLNYYSSTLFTGSGTGTQTLEIAQYGASNFVPQIPTCYYQFQYSNNTWSASVIGGHTPYDCSVTGSGNTFTITMQWPPASTINYQGLGQNLQTVLQGFLSKKTYGNPSPLFPNQVPLSSDQMNNFTGAISSNPSGNGWALQFGYDVIRVPMWFGAYYAQDGSGPLSSTVKTYLQKIDTFMSSNLCSIPNSSDKSINTNGFWAYTVSGVGQDGQAVQQASCSNTPSLEGPLAMAAKAIGDTTTLNALVTTLNDYSIANNTFTAYEATAGSQISEGAYTSSSTPYFSTVLDLLNEALLIGNGSFDLTKATDDSSFPYLTIAGFNQNYQAWLNDGFVVSATATDPKNPNSQVQTMRVLYSTYNGVDYKDNDPKGTVGNAPTVSEGMGYSLLISYAANDQTSFDKFLWYILLTAHYEGCAGMNQDQSACSVKSEYLMPWMVDASGKPFHYAVGGNYLTSGSAYDADSQIVMALYLASQRVASGAWKNSLFDGQTYSQIAKAMVQEINRYDTSHNVSYYGTPLTADNGVLFTPGSQWGAPLFSSSCTGNTYSICGTDLIYPGYISPQAFQAMSAVQSSS